MNAAPPKENLIARASGLFLSAIIAVAAVGYFVGINDGVPRADMNPVVESLLANRLADNVSATDGLRVIPARSYSEMRRSEDGPTSHWKQTLEQIPKPAYDLFAEIKPSEKDKQQSTWIRSSRRAFNGAPPVIPHSIERTGDAACYSCHGSGMRIGDRVANQMSHGFLANCTQCHAPPPPKPLADHEDSFESSFVGLPAPLKGERAFAGAPPTIPHSTWMRETCLACHGKAAGWSGFESTHPWRTNCLQCHPPSAILDQAITADPVGFLSAPVVEQP